MIFNFHKHDKEAKKVELQIHNHTRGTLLFLNSDGIVSELERNDSTIMTVYERDVEGGSIAQMIISDED